MGIWVLLLAPFAIAARLFLPGSTPRINRRRHPNGLAALEEVPLNGTRQWILIRSEDVANPVVLFLHGGPGTSQLTLNRRNTKSLEKYFTVVNWDQRGAGKSFAAGRDRSRMTIAQFVDDVIALSTMLAARFHKNRIALVGHSWGTVIGLLAVAKRPDLFSAYVGIGQLSDVAESERLSYEWTLEQARTRGERAAAEKLAAIGPPPYTGAWRRKFLTERQFVARYGGEVHGSSTGAFGAVLRHLLISREYTATDRFNFFRGIFRSLDALFAELYLGGVDLFRQVPEVKVPVFFCLGRHDREVPSTLSERYFEALKTPRKQLVWFEQSAHMVNTEERDAFNRFLIETVRPAIASE